MRSVQVQPGKLQLTGFYIGGRAVSTLTESNGTQVTERPVAESNHFTVSYLDNTFTLEFSLLNYVGAANVVFEHRLNGGRMDIQRGRQKQHQPDTPQQRHLQA